MTLATFIGQSLPVPHFMLSRQGRILKGNDEVAKMLRVQRRSFDGMPVSVFLDRPSLQAFLNHLWDSFQRPGETLSIQVQFLRSDQTTLSCVLYSQANLDGEEEHCQTVAVILPESTPDVEVAREMFANLPYGVAWLDSNEKVLDCSPALCALLDFDQNQVRGCPISRLFFDWDSESALASALRKRPFRLQGISREGDLIPVQVHLLPTESETGKRRFLFIVRDLRDQEDLERRSLRMAEMERQAVGRELHDALGQNLVGMAFLADELAGALGQSQFDHKDAQQRAQRLAKLSREIIGISRNLVRGLYPVGLTDGGLAVALRDLAERCGQSCSVECQAHCQAVDVAPEIGEHLFRIAQEALTNAIKHAGCGLVQIRMAEADECVVLRVLDDGRGITEADLQRFGNGISSMRHRCQLIGSDLSIRRGESGGTLVTVRLPNPKPNRPYESLEPHDGASAT